MLGCVSILQERIWLSMNCPVCSGKLDLDLKEKIAEELIDVIFYLLDASRLACPSVNMDAVFREKLKKNLSRPYQYGEGHRTK